MKLHKNIRLLTWFNFFLDLRFFGPVAILYFTQISGSFALGMSIFSTTMLFAALFEIPTGVFSDMAGRKKTVIFGAIASIISLTLYAIGINYWFLFAGAVLEGLARSFFSGNNDALLHDSLREVNQTKAFSEFLGKTSSTAQVALTITAVIGSVIANWSYTWVMWLSVLPSLVCLWLSLKLVEPAIQKEESENFIFHIKKALILYRENNRLKLLSLASIIDFAKGEASYLFRSAFIETLWPVWAIGLSSMVANGGAAISFYFSGKWIKRFGELKILVTRELFTLVSNLLALVFPNITSPIILSSSSVFFGVGMVSMNTLMQKEYSEEQRSTMGSMNALAGSITFTIIASCLGLMADLLSPAKALLILQVLIIFPLWIYRRLSKPAR
ncbi:MAG: MFS transporter [Anaerolineaceae bacterium]|nr:MFS transporter [Anaerolineaceae bacterium]